MKAKTLGEAIRDLGFKKAVGLVKFSRTDKCLPECRTKFDTRRSEGSRYYRIHSPRCRAGCSEPQYNPVDEANAPQIPPPQFGDAE